jgi:hypothetical protein
MKEVAATQLELVTPDMLNDFHIGWYYGYNPARKPYKGTILPVCQLIDVIDTPIGPRCIVKVIGDIANKEAYASQLSPMILLKKADIDNFSETFRVESSQMKIWRLASESE